MTRFLLLITALVVGLFVLRRVVFPGKRTLPPRRERGDAPSTLVCADCSTRYDPQITGWTCPRCGK